MCFFLDSCAQVSDNVLKVVYSKPFQSHYLYMKAFGEATPYSVPMYFWGCKWSNPWLRPPEPSSIQPDGRFIHRTIEPDPPPTVTKSKGAEPPTGEEEEEEAMAAMGKRNNTADSLLLL